MFWNLFKKKKKQPKDTPALKYLIAGLGNIGEEYHNTRHNIGFEVVDFIANEKKAKFALKRHAFQTVVKHKGRQLFLIKPTTYVNLSGKAVNYWLQKENIPLKNFFVIIDDIALPFGAVRIKSKGSDGGHNGLAHIIQTIGQGNFARLRFGIGNDFYPGQQADYVLSQWKPEEQKKLPERIEKMAEAVKSFSTIGIERTMNFYNGK